MIEGALPAADVAEHAQVSFKVAATRMAIGVTRSAAAHSSPPHPVASSVMAPPCSTVAWLAPSHNVAPQNAIFYGGAAPPCIAPCNEPRHHRKPGSRRHTAQPRVGLTCDRSATER